VEGESVTVDRDLLCFVGEVGDRNEHIV
jgi:hypothetical protein